MTAVEHDDNQVYIEIDCFNCCNYLLIKIFCKIFYLSHYNEF